MAMLIRLTILVAFFPTLLFAHGSVHERLVECDRRIEASPRNAALFVVRGRLHREHRDHGAARRDFLQALKLDGSSVEAKSSLADLHLADADAELAALLATSILTDHPEVVAARLTLARAHVALRQFELAVVEFDRVIARVKRPSPDLYLERLRAVRAARPDDHREALRGLEAGIARLGPIVSLIKPTVEIQVARGDHTGAFNRLASLERQAARKEPWQIWRAELLLSADRREEAIALARSASDALARSKRARSRHTQRLLARAAQVIRSAEEKAKVAQ